MGGAVDIGLVCSYAANGVFFAATGAVCAYFGMQTCFPKRHRATLFWVYFPAKGRGLLGL